MSIFSIFENPDTHKLEVFSPSDYYNTGKYEVWEIGDTVIVPPPLKDLEICSFEPKPPMINLTDKENNSVWIVIGKSPSIIPVVQLNYETVARIEKHHLKRYFMGNVDSLSGITENFFLDRFYELAPRENEFGEIVLERIPTNPLLIEDCPTGVLLSRGEVVCIPPEECNTTIRSLQPNKEITDKQKKSVWVVIKDHGKYVDIIQVNSKYIKYIARYHLAIFDFDTTMLSELCMDALETNGISNIDSNLQTNIYQLTALGLNSSGKTCFMAGMYYKMTGGVNGYTLKANDDDSVKLTTYYEQMENSFLGTKRFPCATNQRADYIFELQYGFKSLERFRWIDYAGATLKSKNMGEASEYQKLKEDIAKSEMLFIFVDGGLFLNDDLKTVGSDTERIELLANIVMSSNSRQINHFLSEYTGERQKLPPIAIIITKFDLAIKALGKITVHENVEMLNKIIHKAFNPLFPDPRFFIEDNGQTSLVGIIPVSLGMKISEENYTGKLSPINMHLPAFIGIWFMLKKSNRVQDGLLSSLAHEIEDSGIAFWLNGQTGKFSSLAEAYLKKLTKTTNNLLSVYYPIRYYISLI